MTNSTYRLLRTERGRASLAYQDLKRTLPRDTDPHGPLTSKFDGMTFEAASEICNPDKRLTNPQN